MKFKVRDGYIIHDVQVRIVSGERLETTNVYPAGEIVDFDEDQANDHLHKLEPQDKAATAFVEKRFVPPPAVTQAPTIDPAVIAQIVAATVAAMAPQAAAPAAPAGN